MDLVASCEEKLAHFRVKELKDVLTQFGLSKQGRKQDLVDRILLVLAAERGTGTLVKKNVVRKEEVAKLIDDIYRKMQVSGANDLASKAQAVSEISNVKLKEEVEDSYQMEEIRCLCRSVLQTESMIKCEDPRCHVWQHINCVIIPENPMDGVLPKPPDSFYCELCRLSRADPFLVTVSHPLYPLKLTITSGPADGSNPVLSAEKNFQLSKMEKDLLLKQEYDVQAWCMLLNDKVPFRMQWPQYADLQVNGVPVRAINRPGSQLLGANGRDDGPIITPCTRDGMNKITLTGCDTRVFCLGVRIVKRRTVQQILNMIPKEVDGEKFEDALARVRRCVGGGTAMENADSDSDIEVVAHFVPVNLRCPMSGSRMKVAGRFKPCIHMGCFDLDVFVEMNQRSRKWQCPICLKNYALENVIIDPYFNRITSKLRHFGEEVTEIEVKPDGSWRAKAEGDKRNLGELGLWHLPDGSLCLPTEGESKPTLEVLREVKQENGSEGHTGLKLGMKKNRNGIWEIRHPDDPQRSSSGNVIQDNFENQNIIHMSSSATGSGKDGDDPSVNQDGGGNKYFSTTNGVEFDSAYGLVDQNPSARPGDAEVIVLSDSDVEDEALISTGLIDTNNPNDGGGVQFSVPTHGISNSYHDDSAIGAGGSSSLGLFNTNDDEYAMHMWNLPTGGQGGPGFQLFGSDTNVNVQHGTINCPIPLGGYAMTSDTAMGSGTFVPDSSAERPNAEMDGLASPIAFGGNDPSLQIFLPTRPSDFSAPADMTFQADVPNGVRSEDWTSLRLGGSDGRGGQGNPGAVNGINSGEQLQPNEGALDSLANTASLLLGMNGSNENRSFKPSRQRSDGPFSFPRQRRSVRPRYLSIDSDSN